jgi:kynurenine formamidase
MRRHAGVALGLACLVLAGCAASSLPIARNTRIVDLSHAYDAETIFWPTEKDFVLESEFAGMTDGGYYYEANRFSTAEHGGTHIDAPVHFAEGHWTVDAIPLDRLIGEAVVVSVREACAADPEHQISIDDIAAWEAQHGQIPAGAIVLLDTGFARYWPDRQRYMGTDGRGADAALRLRFPGLHADAARWLVRERKIRAVGLDTPSIDHGQSKLFETHRVLFEQDVPAFENLTGLDALPPRGFQVVALPMKIRGGSGAPLRIIALVPEAE